MKTQTPTGFSTSGYQAGAVVGELAQLQRLLGESGEQAEERLTAACLRRPVLCPKCRAGGARPEGGRYRCQSCPAVFELFDARWLSRRQISPRAWVLTLKCFELGLGGQQISDLTGLSMPTVYKTLETIRLALAGAHTDGAGARSDEEFARYLRRQTAKHCGIPAKSLPLYVKEYEWRFRFRGRPLFEALLEAVCRLERSES